LESTQGIGLLAGGLLLSVWGGFKRRILTSLGGIIGVGAGILLVGLAPANMYTVALVGMALCGVMLSLANGPMFAIFQSSIEPEIQGRIFTVIGSVASAMSPLGMAISAPIGEYLGVRTWFFLAGALTILMGMVGLMIPAIMQIEEQAKRRTNNASITPLIANEKVAPLPAAD